MVVSALYSQAEGPRDGKFQRKEDTPHDDGATFYIILQDP